MSAPEIYFLWPAGKSALHILGLFFEALEGDGFAGTEGAFSEVGAVFGCGGLVGIAYLYVVEFCQNFFYMGSGCIGKDLDGWVGGDG